MRARWAAAAAGVVLAAMTVIPANACTITLRAAVVTTPPIYYHAPESGVSLGPSLAGATVNFYLDGGFGTGACGRQGSFGSWRITGLTFELSGTLFHKSSTEPGAPGCPDDAVFDDYFLTVTGGTGPYAGATGSGVWHRTPVPRDIVAGSATVPAPGEVVLSLD